MHEEKEKERQKMRGTLKLNFSRVFKIISAVVFIEAVRMSFCKKLHVAYIKERRRILSLTCYILLYYHVFIFLKKYLLFA